MSLGVIPAVVLAAFFGDQECNHLDGDVMVAVGPRGSWCDAVLNEWRWLWLMAAATLTTLVLAWVADRRPWLLLLAWCVGAAVALLPMAYLSGLRAYPLA